MTVAGAAVARASDAAQRAPTDSRSGLVAGTGPERGPTSPPAGARRGVSSQAGLATFRYRRSGLW